MNKNIENLNDFIHKKIQAPKNIKKNNRKN